MIDKAHKAHVERACVTIQQALTSRADALLALFITNVERHGFDMAEATLRSATSRIVEHASLDLIQALTIDPLAQQHLDELKTDMGLPIPPGFTNAIPT